jgi:hypothetical protein
LARGVVACLVVAVPLTVWLVWGRRDARTSEPRAVAARNLLAGAVARDAVGPALSGLRWEDVGPTAAGTGARAGLRREVVDALASDPRAEAYYLRGLLQLAEQRPEYALAAFDAIPVDRMPALHLYAPFRLHAALRPGRPNRYWAPLVAARRDGRLPPLVAARVAVAEGDLKAAVASYVSSDPAQWARHDLDAFRALLLHAGLSPDTRTMLVAAMRAGRVPDRLRQDLERLLSTAGQSAPADEVKARLRRLLADNPAAREVAVAAATEQLRVRRLFLERQYVTLVREHRASDPTNLTDAALVILMLSASRVGETDMSDLWAQELRRRYPAPDVVRWIAEVRAGRS